MSLLFVSAFLYLTAQSFLQLRVCLFIFQRLRSVYCFCGLFHKMPQAWNTLHTRLGGRCPLFLRYAHACGQILSFVVVTTIPMMLKSLRGGHLTVVGQRLSADDMQC